MLLRRFSLVRLGVPFGAALFIETGFVVVGRQWWLRLLIHGDGVAPGGAAQRRFSPPFGRLMPLLVTRGGPLPFGCASLCSFESRKPVEFVLGVECCPLPIDVGSEVRGMLNISGHVFPIAAEVRHASLRAGRYDVGVSFRHLRDEERALFTQLTFADESGRRSADGRNAAQPRAEDIRDGLRRWTA